ncbi:MAG: hypothetical protein ACM3X1_10000 [Ignavibacteriales bacterium]
MPHYIVLFNFTEQGRRTIKDLKERAEAAKDLIPILLALASHCMEILQNNKHYVQEKCG